MSIATVNYATWWMESGHLVSMTLFDMNVSSYDTFKMFSNNINELKRHN